MCERHTSESLCLVQLLTDMYADMENNNTNVSLDDPYYEKWPQYKHFAFILDIYFGTPLILRGLVGNTIAFWTLGKLMRQNSTTSLLRGLAVADICILLCYGVHFCSLHTQDLSPVILNILPYLRLCFDNLLSISLMVNIWTTVVVGMNRYIALCRPLEATRLCTTSHARGHMACIVFISIVYQLPRFFDYTIKREADGTTYTELVLYIYTPVAPFTNMV